MADENVVRMPNELERLADKLRVYLERDDANREDWIEIQEGICLTLAEARGKFTADVEFGQWCASNGFGDNTLSRDTRAAAITMGQEPDALRECLKATERSSLRLIYRDEFVRFRTVAKPSPRARKPKLDLGNPSPQFEKAKDAVDELRAKGEPTTVKAVQATAGVGETSARRAIAHKRAEAEAEAALDPLTPAEMNKTLAKRYELALKKARSELREELRQEVYAECDVYVAHIKERAERAERILASHQGVMSREAFRKIKACLHPDHNTFALATEALQIFSELEDVLVKPEIPASGAPPLPSTAAELMARRKRR